jgi:hypothetical protein
MPVITVMFWLFYWFYSATAGFVKKLEACVENRAKESLMKGELFH